MNTLLQANLKKIRPACPRWRLWGHPGKSPTLPSRQGRARHRLCLLRMVWGRSCGFWQPGLSGCFQRAGTAWLLQDHHDTWWSHGRGPRARSCSHHPWRSTSLAFPAPGKGHKVSLRAPVGGAEHIFKGSPRISGRFCSAQTPCVPFEGAWLLRSPP